MKNRPDAFDVFLTSLSSAFDKAQQADTGGAREEFKTLNGAALSGISRARELHRAGDDATALKVVTNIIPWALEKTEARIGQAPEARAAYNKLLRKTRQATRRLGKACKP